MRIIASGGEIMCCKDIVIGLAVGMVAGYVLRGIPSVKTATDEIKTIIEKDVVNPIKNFVTTKTSDCNCHENQE